jgi:hypothetical protein
MFCRLPNTFAYFVWYGSYILFYKRQRLSGLVQGGGEKLSLGHLVHGSFFYPMFFSSLTLTFYLENKRIFHLQNIQKPLA